MGFLDCMTMLIKANSRDLAKVTKEFLLDILVAENVVKKDRDYQNGSVYWRVTSIFCEEKN